MLFSIIIPAYNAEKFIHRSVNSVLSQTFTDFELIVVNDGSSDNTEQKIAEFTDPRFIAVSKQNEGVSVARNTGIQKAIGEFICFLDADDEFMPNHLELLAKTINTYPDKHFFATRYCIEVMSGYVESPDTTETVTYYKDTFLQIMRNPEFVWTGCVCIRKTMFEKYGMFVPCLKLGEDTDMWKRVYARTGVVHIDTVTVKRNRDGSEATKNYQRSFTVDLQNRVPEFLADEEISEDVKNSIRTLYEWEKLSVVRSYLFEGNKNEAMNLLAEIDKSRIPKKRIVITKICFLIPSSIIRVLIKKRNGAFYK